MEGITQKVRRQILADFYQKNLAKGKQHTFDHFVKMGYKKSLEALKRRIRQKIHDADQAQVIQLFRSIKSNIVRTASEAPYATFH